MLLITGHPRSGTTILQRVLSQHPEISLTNELQCFVGLGQPVRARHLRRLLRRGLRRRNHTAAFSARPRRWAWGYNTVCTARLAWCLARCWNQPLEPATLERGYRRLFPAARWVGDKSPSYVFDLEPLLAAGLTVVVIYRDGRDVVASTLEAARTLWRGMRHSRQLDTADKVARRWVEATEQMARHAESLTVLRYEDLALRPEPTLAALAERLGVDPAGLRPELVRATSVGRYRDELSKGDLATVEAIASATLRRLGYV